MMKYRPSSTSMLVIDVNQINQTESFIVNNILFIQDDAVNINDDYNVDDFK